MKVNCNISARHFLFSDLDHFQSSYVHLPEQDNDLAQTNNFLSKFPYMDKYIVFA